LTQYFACSNSTKDEGETMVKILRSIFILALALSFALPASAQNMTSGEDSELLIPDGPISVEVSPVLVQSSGEVEVWVQLIDAPLAVVQGHNAKQLGGALTPAQQRAYLKQLGAKQNKLMSQISGLGGSELGRVSKAHNAVAVTVDASQIPAIAALPNVLAIRPVVNYELALDDVRSYIGATDAEAAGFEWVRRQGSHNTFRSADGRIIVIQDHGKQVIVRSLLRKIIRDMGLTVDEYSSLVDSL
jgi:predicted RNA binding protein YcfA (HicA-like mRNA interferase family)